MSKKPKHTTDWSYNHDTREILDEDGDPICVMARPGMMTTVGNFLVAPDLRAQCDDLLGALKLMDYYMTQMELSTNANGEVIHCVRVMKAAIARAEGRKS